MNSYCVKFGLPSYPARRITTFRLYKWRRVYVGFRVVRGICASKHVIFTSKLQRLLMRNIASKHMLCAVT